MTIRFARHLQGLSGGDWRAIAARLLAGQAEVNQNAGLMSAYERQQNQAELAGWREQARQVIYAGAIGERDAALESYQQAQQKLAKARDKEERRWDAGKLLSEIQLAKEQVSAALSSGAGGRLAGGPSAAERLQQLYDGARRGDEHRQRAVTEALRYAELPPGAQLDARQSVNRLAKQAERDYASLRRTEEISQAGDQARTAAADLAAKQEGLIFAAGAVGDVLPHGPLASGPLTRAYKRVTFEPDGGVTIHEPNAPEVTGIFWADPVEVAGSAAGGA